MKDELQFDRKHLDRFGKQYVGTLVGFLKKYNKSASGALINSIDYRLQETAQEIKLIIDANDYLKYVDEGRKPGKFPPIQAIEKWTKLKGIPQSAVFPIAKSIFKFGIEPTNVIEDSLKSFEGIGVEIVEEMVDESVQNYVVQELNKIKDINE